MSSLPECKICGKYQHHGEVVCLECEPKKIQAEREKVLENLIVWIRETKDMARTNLDHDWGTRGDRHVELILSQVLDKYAELRQSKDGD